jgi:SAM-dependent methyltransferase
MADITATPGTTACCTTQTQTTCCAPSEKADCCDSKAAGEPCGCAAGQTGDRPVAIREAVRDHYASAARTFAGSRRASCGCSPTGDSTVFGSRLYDGADVDDAAAGALEASLGCGVPTAVADLHEGEVVLDLGSGAGADVLISARRVGPTGRAIGLDMTDEMLALARENAAAAGVANAEFLKGYLEAIPLPDASVDVVISNCVINLAADKFNALKEAARVLKPGGRFAVSDVIADPGMDAGTRADMAAYTGCIAGALTENEFSIALSAVGLRDIEIQPTHRVHEHAASAVVRARKPEAP